jgi:hypothetical protein
MRIRLPKLGDKKPTDFFQTAFQNEGECSRNESGSKFYDNI